MNWHKFDIDITQVRGGKTFCPKCHDSRKNKHDRSLSVDKETGLFMCHNSPCDFKGCASDKPFKKEKKEYTVPPPRLEKLSPDVIEWFEGERKISNNTLLRMGVTESVEWMPQTGSDMLCVCFNYYRDGELVNIKFRGPEKEFKMVSGAELIFYNLDGIKGEKEAIITEGEPDALSCVESGIYNVVSVPNGASKGNNKLEYLDNCWEYFEDKERIIIATDNDEAGIALRDELARRLGKHRCFKVDFPEGCKDTNDVLVKYGVEAVRGMYANSRPWPLDGILTLEDVYSEVQSLYDNGYPPGLKSGIPEFDQYASFNTINGELWTVVGIPNHGKSEFVDYIMASMRKNHGWKWAICAFETPVAVHNTLLMEKLSGKAFGFRTDKTKRMNTHEAEQAIMLIDNHFFFFNIDDEQGDFTIDGLIEKFRQLVVSRGVNGIVIDPWSYVEMRVPPGRTETQYVQECIIKIKKFCALYGTHVFIVCHPSKMQKDEKTGKYHVPTLYSINGSAWWFSLTDNGICVYRNFDTGVTDVHIQKWKRSWLGQVGMCNYTYNTQTRQYEKPMGLL